MGDGRIECFFCEDEIPISAIIKIGNNHVFACRDCAKEKIKVKKE